MTDEMMELAKRAIACKGWRWMPGMLAVSAEHQPARVLSVQSDEYEPPMLEVAWSWRDGDGVHPRDWLPDLTDPATLGCLLALVREAYPWGYSLVRECDYEHPIAQPVRAFWVAQTGEPRLAERTMSTSRAAALVAALEVAP